MNRPLVVVGIFAVTVIGSLAHADEMKAEVGKHLKPLECYIGEWVNEFENEDGNSVRITAAWEWGPGRAAIRSHFTVKVAGKVTMTGVGITGWDTAKNCPMSVLFISNGMRLQGTESIEREGFFTGKVAGVTADGDAFETTGSTEFTDKNTMMSKLGGRKDMEFKRVKK